MHPGFPVVGIHRCKEYVAGRQPVHVEAFSDMLHDGPGWGRTVVPLVVLLRRAATDRS